MEDAVLVLVGEMTAMQIAGHVGHTTPREVVPCLNVLLRSGRISRRVDAGPEGEDSPVARWSLPAA